MKHSRINRFAATSALIVSALAVGSASAGAAPVAVHRADAPDPIHYDAHRAGRSVDLRIDKGAFVIRDGRLDVVDPVGRTAARLPLGYALDGVVHPINARVLGKTAVLTPRTEPVSATVADPHRFLHPADALANLPDAAGAAYSDLGIATATGTLIGTIIGGGLGCIVGAAVGLPFAIVPGAAGGCLAGLALGGAAGAMIGTIALGAPMLPIAGYQFFTMLNAPKPAK